MATAKVPLWASHNMDTFSGSYSKSPVWIQPIPVSGHPTHMWSVISPMKAHSLPLLRAVSLLLLSHSHSRIDTSFLSPSIHSTLRTLGGSAEVSTPPQTSSSILSRRDFSSLPTVTNSTVPLHTLFSSGCGFTHVNLRQELPWTFLLKWQQSTLPHSRPPARMSWMNPQRTHSCVFSAETSTFPGSSWASSHFRTCPQSHHQTGWSGNACCWVWRACWGGFPESGRGTPPAEQHGQGMLRAWDPSLSSTAPKAYLCVL